MVDLVEKARSFALEAHKGQVRNNKREETLVSHIEEVASLVKESGGTDREIAAAYLHDTVEDTTVTLSDISENFGEDVAAIVDGLTDPPEFSGLPTFERKIRQAERLLLKSDSVKRVKIADQIANVRSVGDDPPVNWEKEKCLDYINGTRFVAFQCYGISEFLDYKFRWTYHVSKRKIIKPS